MAWYSPNMCSARTVRTRRLDHLHEDEVGNFSNLDNQDRSRGLMLI